MVRRLIGCKQCVIGIWAAMLVLTSIENLNLITKRNLMACAVVGAVFAAYHADVINMLAIFEEPAKHMFAGIRGFFKMFTVLADIPFLDKKVHHRESALVQHGITSQPGIRSIQWICCRFICLHAAGCLHALETASSRQQCTTKGNEPSPPAHHHRNGLGH